ncbi:NADH pyrophosphatase [Pseudoalteromonas holothuriae]|uniref:NADH pyrophosphatase n=1 Tax=Pseudoalteromonas holothuriae TaxID=2963714 RepID=A0A9W4QSV2_9GAMM|nr:MULTISPECIES: NUDIX hydrolase [unclassified Pseudoalteromonas]CAH9051465.1 NADH pyrophosphatase [Pseudoalteromonas sp. CIP111854]CAH9056949.1 NADH pyrophosphatase [Pseudoalteromonas sp. CIP111951]
MVRVGVAVIIVRDGKFLLGERMGAHGSGTWATPGGHLEVGETIEQCAQREVSEETGLVIKKTVKLGFTNDIFEGENKHYVTLFMLAYSDFGIAEVKEPNKCTQWQWCALDNLPSPLFLSLKHFLADNYEQLSECINKL